MAAPAQAPAQVPVLAQALVGDQKKANAWPTVLKVLAIAAIAFGVYKAAIEGAFGSEHVFTAAVTVSVTLLALGLIYYTYLGKKKKQELERQIEDVVAMDSTKNKVSTASIAKFAFVAAVMILLGALLIKYELANPGGLKQFWYSENVTIGASIGGGVALALSIDYVYSKCITNRR